MTQLRIKGQTMPIDTNIPHGARELLEACSTYADVVKICEQQGYSCQMWGWKHSSYVLFADPVTDTYPEGKASLPHGLFLNAGTQVTQLTQVTTA